MSDFSILYKERENILGKYVLLYSPLLSSFSIVTLGSYIKFPQQNILIAINPDYQNLKQIQQHKQQQITQKNGKPKPNPPRPAT